MTETCGGCVYDGRPLDGVNVELAPDGTIRLSGPVLAGGYHLDPERTAAAFDGGWFSTSDRGRFDRDGRLEVLGRTDDVIVTGGENVSGASVAGALRAVAGISDAAVLGLDDPEWGQLVAAVVVCDGAPVTLEQVRDALRERLPRHALPRALRVVEALPRDALGKVPVSALRALFEDDRTD
jgi:o-succinylbenzoate---CoA ligase